MLTIDKINNLTGLFGMISYLDKLKPKSIIALYVKICNVASQQNKVGELVDQGKFKELTDFMAENWVFGSLGIQTKISNDDRINVLLGMATIGIKSNKLLGETCNLIMADQITNADAVTQILHVMARFQYTPSLSSNFEDEESPDS